MRAFQVYWSEEVQLLMVFVSGFAIVAFLSMLKLVEVSASRESIMSHFASAILCLLAGSCSSYMLDHEDRGPQRTVN